MRLRQRDIVLIPVPFSDPTAEKLEQIVQRARRDQSEVEVLAYSE